MKLSLGVLTPGRWQGKVIPVTRAPFLVGRAPECHLRPASASISNRHCALIVRGGKLFVHDYDSTNGTFVNGRQVKGEVELHNDDRLRIGPLEFMVCLEMPPAVEQPTPLSPTRASAPAAEDAPAALLLPGEDDEQPGSNVDSQGIPTGATAMGIMPPGPARKPAPVGGKPAAPQPEAVYGSVKSRVEEGFLVLTIMERLIQTEKQADSLRHDLITAVDKSGLSKVVIDMEAVDALTSTGLRGLLGAYRHVKRNGGQLVLCHVTPVVARTLTTTRLVGMGRSPFDMAADVGTALTFLQMRR